MCLKTAYLTKDQKAFETSSTGRSETLEYDFLNIFLANIEQAATSSTAALHEILKLISV